MIWLYIATAIFGGIFVVPMVLGGLDLDVGVDADMDGGGDFDLDSGADFDVDVDAGFDVADGGFVETIGDFVGSLLTFRSIVMATMFFGVAGLVFSLFGTNSTVTLIAAIISAIFAAVLNGSIMQFVSGNEASSHLTTSDMQGVQAEVIMPVSPGRKGRIRAQIAGQTEYFVALPWKGRDGAASFDAGDAAVVVEIDNGTAMISPLRSLES